MIVPRVVLIGDTTAASRWIGVAKSFARETYRSGLASHTKRIAADVMLHVSNLFPSLDSGRGLSKVVIVAGAAIPLYHGVFSYLQAGYPGAVPPGGTVPEDEKHPEELTYSFDFLTNKKGSYATSGFEPSKVFLHQFDETDDDNVWIPFPHSASARKAGCYSGEMRKVVQVLAAANSPIFYDYHHTKTHGIYTIPGSKKRLVVEISATGVRYWKLKATYAAKSLLNTTYQLHDKESPLPYVPAAIDAAPKDAKEATVSGTSMADIYFEALPLSNEIGWAFSASGHEAQTILLREFELQPPGLSFVGTYQKAHRYKLSFSYDADKEELSVATTLEESEWFWYGWLQNNIRVPIYTELCGPAHKRLTPVSTLAPIRPKTESYTFPFHVFYDQDTECVFRYTNGNQQDTSLPDTTYPTTGLDGRGIRLDPAYNKVYYQDAVQSVWEVKLTESSGRFDFGEQRQKKRTAFTTKVSQYEGGAYPYAVNPIGAGSPEYLSLDNVFVTKDTASNSSDWEDYLFSFIVPFFDREAFFLYQRSYDYSTYDRVFRSMSAVGKKRHKATMAASWYVYGSYGKCDFGGSSVMGALANRVVDTYCNPGPDLSPPETLVGAYYQIESSGTNQICEPDTQYCETCSNYGSNKMADTFKYYNYIGEVTIPSLHDAEITLDSPPPGSESAAFFNLGYQEKQDMEYHANPLTGTLFEDNTSCEASSPWWLVATVDAMTKKVGFVSKCPVPSNALIKNIGDDTHYELYGFINDTTPSQLFDSGFFGVPFPDQLEDE